VNFLSAFCIFQPAIYLNCGNKRRDMTRDMTSREYPHYAIACVGCVVIKDDKVLLVKRGLPPAQGKWAIPGGAINANEGLFDAAKRELHEETGLIGEPTGIVGVADITVHDERGVKYRYVVIDVLFDANTLKGTLSAMTDAVDVGWFAIDAVVNSNEVSRFTKALLNSFREGNLTVLRLIT